VYAGFFSIEHEPNAATAAASESRAIVRIEHSFDQ
jgi:hypothetical protein